MTSRDILFRRAQRADLPSIVRMLADDDLGSQRERYEDPLPESYYSAFEQIDKDPNHELIVVERNGQVIGTLHLMFLPLLQISTPGVICCSARTCAGSCTMRNSREFVDSFPPQ